MGERMGSQDECPTELDLRRASALAQGGEAGIARQHARGKLTARERIARLLDAGSFHEMGMLAGKGEYDESGAYKSFTPSNSVVGTGALAGRRVVVAADDFTIRGGSSESAVSDKWVYAERYAHQMRMPLVRLVDTAGGSVRLLEQQKATKIPGYANWPWMQLLGQAPVVGVAAGACAGLGAIKVAMSHFSVMTRGVGQVFAGGPPVVKRGIGQEIDKESLGGADVHVRVSGMVTNEARNEDDAFDQVRRFLSYMPDNVWSLPPRVTAEVDTTAADAWLDQAIPEDRRKVYDMRRILKSIFDAGSLFEMARPFGGSIITMLGRLDGCAVGVVANDPRVMGGALTAQAARKLERFVDLCDTFRLPIIKFVDQPGVMFGLEAEKAGTLGAAIRAISAIAQAIVPWCSVIVRRAFGVGGQMQGPQHGPDGYSLNHRYAWPSARWGSIPIEGGVSAAFRQELEDSEDPDARLSELEEFYHRLSSPFRTAERFGIVDVIAPRDTRTVLRNWIQDAYGRTRDQLGPRLRTLR